MTEEDFATLAFTWVNCAFSRMRREGERINERQVDIAWMNQSRRIFLGTADGLVSVSIQPVPGGERVKDLSVGAERIADLLRDLIERDDRPRQLPVIRELLEIFE